MIATLVLVLRILLAHGAVCISRVGAVTLFERNQTTRGKSGFSKKAGYPLDVKIEDGTETTSVTFANRNYDWAETRIVIFPWWMQFLGASCASFISPHPWWLEDLEFNKRHISEPEKHVRRRGHHRRSIQMWKNRFRHSALNWKIKFP